METSGALPRVAALIPTRNRPDHLQMTVRTVLSQTKLPSQLIIVDQSESDEPRARVEREFAAAPEPVRAVVKLVYIHDVEISGGSAARNVGLRHAAAEVVLFLDDDVELEPDFIAEIAGALGRDPGLAALSGVITNYARPGLGLRLWLGTFARGVFHDDRQPVYWNASELAGDNRLIPVRRLGAGLMAAWTERARQTLFDETLRGVCDGEDVDFCLRLGAGQRLAMCPRARLAHKHSPAGRSQAHWLGRYLRGELYLYRRHWKHGLYNRLCYYWLLLGSAAVAIFACARRKRLDPWQTMRAMIQGAAGPLPGERESHSDKACAR
jgi:GT2 family glycosyltransferase